VHIQNFQEIIMHQKRISDQEVIWKVSGRQQNMSRGVSLGNHHTFPGGSPVGVLVLGDLQLAISKVQEKCFSYFCAYSRFPRNYDAPKTYFRSGSHLEGVGPAQNMSRLGFIRKWPYISGGFAGRGALSWKLCNWPLGKFKKEIWFSHFCAYSRFPRNYYAPKTHFRSGGHLEGFGPATKYEPIGFH